jgi:hypothetical protein
MMGRRLVGWVAVVIVATAAARRRFEGSPTLCPHLRDADLGLVVDTSRGGWRERLLNGNRTHCRGARDRKVLAAGAARTGADRVAAFLATFLHHAAIDDTVFYDKVIKTERQDRTASFYDGGAGRAAFAARAAPLLDGPKALSGAFLSRVPPGSRASRAGLPSLPSLDAPRRRLFAHEILALYPDAVVVATAANITAWLGRGGAAGAAGKTAAAVGGAAKDRGSGYLAAKRYARRRRRVLPFFFFGGGAPGPREAGGA